MFTVLLLLIVVQGEGYSSAHPLPNDRQEAPSAKAPEAGTLFLTTERFRLENGDFASAERGSLFVPLDRSNPNGSVIEVEVYRFPATNDTATKRPPIFRLFGGPGFGGFTSEDLDKTDFYQPLRKIADVVVVGQRGIGFSRPNTRCQGPPPVDPDERLTSRQVENRRFEASRDCRSFWEKQGINRNHLNVMEAAADVNAVRKALGYETIMLRGQSFGSHWSMAVMRQYPETVERAVLSGLEGPNATYDLPGGVLNSLKRAAKDAEASDALEDRIPEGGLIRALETVADRLKTEPLERTVEHPETGDTVDVFLGYRDRSWLATGYGSVSDSHHDMAGWPRDLLALYEGDYDTAAREKAQFRSGPPDFPTAAFFLYDCASGITEQRERRIDRDPAVEIIGKPGAEIYQHACPAWDVDLGDEFRTNFETNVPTVMVHGTWDLSTPLENARELRSSFINGRLVTVQRGTHGAFNQARGASDTFAETVDQFLKTGNMDEIPETVILPEPNWIVP